MLFIPHAVLADVYDTLRQWAMYSQAFAGILTGLIAVLGVPLALRQVVNLQRELRRYEEERRRRIDAEANLNISAHYSLTHPSHTGHHDPNTHGRQPGQVSGQPSPAPLPGKRVLRLDLTLENVGEGTVDVLACLVAARELERQGEEVAAEGRDAQWDDLTRHYWDAPDGTFSPGLSTTKHIVYAPDALARIKAHSRKTLARIDQVHDFQNDVYLLYRVFVAARRSARGTDDVQSWAALQRALLNVNAPAFREAAAEQDPLGRVAVPDGWRLFLHHYERLADPKLLVLRAQADREQNAIHDPDEYERTKVRLDVGLQDYVRANLLPAWRAYRADLGRISQSPAGFNLLLANKAFRQRQREIERRFPWADQEIWVEYLYILLTPEMDAARQYPIS
jgi:hypothetical protein